MENKVGDYTDYYNYNLKRKQEFRLIMPGTFTNVSDFPYRATGETTIPARHNTIDQKPKAPTQRPPRRAAFRTWLLNSFGGTESGWASAL